MTKREDTEPLVNRQRFQLTITPDLLAWVEDHARPGGPFGWPSHAYELALACVKRELDALREEAKKRSQGFQAEAYWNLHAEEVSRTAPGKTGPRPKGHEPSVERIRTAGSVDVRLLEWAHKHCIQAGPLQSISQAVEFGILRLQEEERRWKEAVAKAGLSHPSPLWTHYEQGAKDKAGTRRAS